MQETVRAVLQLLLSCVCMADSMQFRASCRIREHEIALSYIFCITADMLFSSQRY